MILSGQKEKRPSLASEDDVMSMVERVVGQKMDAEREQLRAEYKKIEELKEKYKKLERESKSKKKKEKEGKKKETRVVGNIKSPSDTTIYAPGLMKSPVNSRDVTIDKIANFVEEMRIQQKDKEFEEEFRAQDQTTPTSSHGKRRYQSDIQECEEDENEEGSEDARRLAKRMVVEAEQYKATIKKPQGNDTDNDNVNLSDDDFFHLVCHVDGNLRQKIEKGQFVDLEKLLPRDKLKRQSNEAATRLGWWQKGGDTFWHQLTRKRELILFANGTRLSEYTPLYTVKPILTEQGKFGSILMLFILPQVLISGKM